MTEKKPSSAKKHLMTVLRIAFAAAGIGYICWALNWTDYVDAEGVLQPGIMTMLKGANVWLLLAGLATTALIYPILGVRWWMLMRARDMQVTVGKSFRLSMVGCFFNFCMPGTTGGDVVKAYYAAKGSTRKADAVMSVILDRVVGLSGLFVVASVAGAFQWGNPAARSVTIFIWASGGTAVICAMAYFSTRVRNLLRLDSWLHKLPGGGMLAKIDAATVAYRNNWSTVLIAIAMASVLHTILASSAALAGFALGIDVEQIGLLLTVLPVLFLGASVPISYQGLGIMEAIGKPLLVDSDACTMNQLVGMLLLIRLYQILYSLLGSLYLLKGDIHLHPEGLEEMQEEAEEQLDAMPQE